MPGEEFVLTVGPKHRVAYYLVGDVERSKKLLAFLERHKTVGEVLGGLGLIIALVALLEAIPFELRWLSLLSVYDSSREILKLNVSGAEVALTLQH